MLQSSRPSPDPSMNSYYAEQAARSVAEKTEGMRANSGVVSLVLIAVMPGTQPSEMASLKGFTPHPENPTMSKGLVWRGSFDTSGTNLQDAAGKSFVRYIQPNATVG